MNSVINKKANRTTAEEYDDNEDIFVGPETPNVIEGEEEVGGEESPEPIADEESPEE